MGRGVAAQMRSHRGTTPLATARTAFGGRCREKEASRLILQRTRTWILWSLLYVGGLAIMVFMSTGFSVISFFAPVPLAVSTMVLPLLVVILTRCQTGASGDTQVSPSSLLVVAGLEGTGRNGH